jgi:hypothetical protein
MSQVTPTDELSNSVSKLVELNKQITEAREDIKVLVQAEKSIKLQVKKLMTDNGLDVINLKKGKISVRKSARKTGLNKTSVKEGLTSYFNGNEQQAESALKAILDSLPVKESTSLALTGLKDKETRIMVWNQYVYEAMNGNDAENSDYDEDINIDEPLHINDWELEHQDELRYMWGILQQYLYDAALSHRILNYANYEEFVEFCFYNSR